jgi:hypothetical protein
MMGMPPGRCKAEWEAGHERAVADTRPEWRDRVDSAPVYRCLVSQSGAT